jgi:hypothetical protein
VLARSQLAEPADRRFSAIAGVGAIVNHEDLPTGGSDLQEKPRHDGVAPFAVHLADCRRVDCRFRELDLGHSSAHSRADI